MMMVPIGAQAWNDIQMIADFSGSEQTYGASGVNGDDATIIVDASSLTHGKPYNFKIKASNDGGTYWGWDYTFDMTSNSKVTDIYSLDNTGYFKIKHDSKYLKYKFTFNYTNQSDNGQWKWKITVEGISATLTIDDTNITGRNSGRNYFFDIPAANYTAGSPMSFTLKTETGGTATYYTGNFTGKASGDAFTYGTSSSSATMSYSVPSTATGPITVSLLTGSNEVVFAYSESGGGGGGTTTDAAYYLISNFYNNNESGYGSINASDRSMKFKKGEDGKYYFKIPASLYGGFRIYDATADKQYTLTSGNSTFNRGTISNSSGTLVESTSNKTDVYGNYYNGTKPTEGTYTITVNPDTKAYTVTYSNLERVVYVLSKGDNAALDILYDTRETTSSSYDHNYFGNTYFDDGFKVVTNWSANNVSDDEKAPRVMVTGEKCYPYSYLQTLGDGDNKGHHNDGWYDTSNSSTSFCHVGITGAFNVEFNPENGAKNWGRIKLKNGDGGGSPDPIVSSLHIIGPAIPGTTTGDTWNYANAVPMTYDTNENCWTATITTTNAQTATNVFRFIDGTTVTKNWGENSAAAADLARIPYTDTSATGHKADVADPNEVGLVTNGTEADRGGYGDIIFNRPAGTWTVKFYVDATELNTTYTTVYRYTITGTENPDPSVVTTTIKTAGGLYINKVLVDVAYTGDSSTPLYWKVGGAPTTSDNLVSYTDSENNTDNRKFLLSTPGQLYVGDGTNTSDPVTFDFTYSTSENYVGVEKNGTVSQIVTSKGGKDCVNVFFKKSYKDMSIYVWDANAESGKEYLTKVWPGQWMSDDRTLTLNGETFYYVSFPTSDLKPKDGKYKIGFILSNAALGSSKENADATKTRDYFLEFNATDTNVQGVQETMFYALEANVTANKVYEPAGSTYESQEKSTYKGSAAQLFSNNTVYFKTNWTSPIYCHVWKEDGTPLHVWRTNGEMMTCVDAANKIYAYTIPTDYQVNLKFASSTSETSDQTFTGHGGKMYTYSTSSSSWGDAPSSFTTLDAASQTVMNTFLTTPPVTTVESRVYPNGQDYYRNMPNDYTLMLSNTWKHADEPPVVDEQHQESSWQVTSGKHWSGDTNKTYLHIRKNEAYQTVTNLPAGTYTVQAIVRGGGVPVYMKLNDTQVASIILTSDGSDAKTTINQFGRSEQLVEMSTDNTKRGWHKLEGSITLATPGDLKIAVRTDYTADGGSIDLADVFLLRNANTDGNYWTTAPTSETKTECDMSDRSKYNAFSFFDRGPNLNSIIKANQKTVIGMSEDNEPYGATDRRHPCNVVTSSDGSTWRTPMLALTDYASVIVGSENKYGGNPLVSQHAYGTSFAYTADKFSYDRATSAKMMSTMLPFPLTRSQIERMLGSNVKTYTLGNIDKSNLKVTFKETKDNLEAHTPFFFRPLQSETKTKMALNESVSVVAKSGTSSTSPSSPAQGLLGTYKHISDVGTTYKDQDFIPYFYENNTFVWADNDANAKPFRVIFLLNKGGNNARMLNAIFVDDTTTGIDGITENIQQNAPVYSIDGKLVSSDGDTSRLSKGVYVKAGKKFIIK